MKSSISPVLDMYRRLAVWPGGRWLFSRVVCWRAPYFGTIRPLMVTLEPGRCEVRIARRRRVANHIGTVHVIAICNGLEMAAGVMAEASIPRHLRWIPKGMEVHYVAKSEGDVTCSATLDGHDWTPGDQPVTVEARLDDGTVVVAGTIHFWISEKPKA